MEAGEQCRVERVSWKHLEQLTDNFSEENFIGNTLFGKVYHGKTPDGQDVTVKHWPDLECYRSCSNYNLETLQNELFFLRQPSVKKHPNVAKVMAYCHQGKLMGVVYDLKAKDTLHNLALTDDFPWLDRIQAALGFAHLLDFLHSHEPPYVVRNISADHVMLDKDSNPVLFDFGMMIGGAFGCEKHPPGQTRRALLGCHGYRDPTLLLANGWSESTNIFSFGVVLLGLISNRFHDGQKFQREGGDESCFVNFWAEMEYKRQKSMKLEPLLVHESFKGQADFHVRDGVRISELALRCVDRIIENRPSMTEIIRHLESPQLELSDKLYSNSLSKFSFLLACCPRSKCHPSQT